MHYMSKTRSMKGSVGSRQCKTMELWNTWKNSWMTFQMKFRDVWNKHFPYEASKIKEATCSKILYYLELEFQGTDRCNLYFLFTYVDCSYIHRFFPFEQQCDFVEWKTKYVTSSKFQQYPPSTDMLASSIYTAGDIGKSENRICGEEF